MSETQDLDKHIAQLAADIAVTGIASYDRAEAAIRSFLPPPPIPPFTDLGVKKSHRKAQSGEEAG